MKIAVYPGSFDPITYGHLDVIERAAGIFDKVLVAICVNPGKQPLFSMEERLEMIQHECAKLTNVDVVYFRGLLSDFVRQKSAHVIIRGLRAISDFENEYQMALMNRKLNNSTETIFLVAKPQYSYLSSSIVKEIASLGGDVTAFVPEHIALKLEEKLLGKK